MKQIESTPQAELLLTSLRSVGYSEEAAIADIIDNAISANASEIHISFDWDMTNYFEMAFKGKEDCIEFEKVTTKLFKDIFDFDAVHLGQTGSKSAPDILLISEKAGYQAVLDTKAYHKYGISGDHHNRMVHNYLEQINNYSESQLPIGFFGYVAGGFVSQIDKQIRKIADESRIPGAGITVSNMISLIENDESHNYSHEEICRLFGVNRQILLNDIQRI